MEYFELGSAPYGEDCVQVSRDGNYYGEMHAEATRYATELGKLYPTADFRVKSFDHDFGRYCEVIVSYDDYVECNNTICEEWGECDCISDSYALALEIEGNLPKTWKELAERIEAQKVKA